MYVILTSKPGLYHTELGDGLRPVEAYDYIFGATRRAHFVIAELVRDIKVVVVDEAEPPMVNRVPSKFLEQFASVEAARGALQHLTRFGSVRARLEAAAP